MTPSYVHYLPNLIQLKVFDNFFFEVLIQTGGFFQSKKTWNSPDSGQ